MLLATVITPQDQQAIYFVTFAICQKIAFILRIQHFPVQLKQEKGHIKHWCSLVYRVEDWGSSFTRRSSAFILSIDLLYSSPHPPTYPILCLSSSLAPPPLVEKTRGIGYWSSVISNLLIIEIVKILAVFTVTCSCRFCCSFGKGSTFSFNNSLQQVC